VPQHIQVVDAVRPGRSSRRPGTAPLGARLPSSAGDPDVLTGQGSQAGPLRQAITGTRPARETRFGSSNDAWIFGCSAVMTWTCLVLTLKFAMFPQLATLRRCR